MRRIRLATAGCCDPATKHFWIWNIPIVGGFCAPTDSPEKSCLRHFSNEFTLPLARRFLQCLPLLEHNCVCVTVGRIGCAVADRSRRTIMLSACCMNLFAMFILILATIGGLASQPLIVSKLAWMRATGANPNLPGATLELYGNLRVHYARLGYIAPAQRDLVMNRTAGPDWSETSTGYFEWVTHWDDDLVCKRLPLESVAFCEDCKNRRLPRHALVLSILTQLPTMATNLQRATRYGDVNCQAGMGFATNFVSLCTSMVALVSFKMSCLSDSPVVTTGASVDWRAGPGFMLMMLGTLVKIIDMIVHCSVPTPRQRWKRPGREVTGLAEYMAMAPEQPEGEHKIGAPEGEQIAPVGVVEKTAPVEV